MSASPPPPIFPPENDANSFAAEFLHHPDFRATAAFILGWVFWSSLTYTYKSHFFQILGKICWGFIRRVFGHSQASDDVEARMSADTQSEKDSLRSGVGPGGIRLSNEAAMVFTLNLCYMFASFADFCSILAYDPGGADTACAFTVAWGSMAGQAARLIGLAILVFELKQRGARAVEFYCLFVALVLALSFILAYNATNTGDIVHIRTLGMSICIKDMYLPTALLTSLGFIVVEVYVVIRLLSWRERSTGLVANSASIQIARAGSLLLIDVLTLAPNVVVTGILAQFIPLSVGALLVLTAFNQQPHDDEGRRDTSFPAPSVPNSRMPTPQPSLPSSRQPTPILIRGSSGTPQNQGAIIIDNMSPSRRHMETNKTLPSFTAPNSAPPRIGDTPVFEDLQARQILPFQVQYAEQLERYIHSGPIVPMRPKRQRPHVQVVIENIASVKTSRNIPSTIIGSDIIRHPSAAPTSRSDHKPWSPTSTATPSEYTTHTSFAVTPTTTTRDSNLSMATSTFNRSLSNGSRNIVSSILARQTSRKKMRSPAEPAFKTPWRSAPRTSFASGRTFGGRDELPPVAEGRTEGAPGSHAGSRAGSWRGSHSSDSRRPVISRPHSLRPTRPPSPNPARVGLGLQLPDVTMGSRPSSSQHLAVPERLRSYGLPDSPASTRTAPRYAPPSPPPFPSSYGQPSTPPSASFARTQGSGRLHGPRSPPVSGSTPNLRSAWPAAVQEPQAAATGKRGHRRKRSDSCPELPPLDLGNESIRPYPSTRR
ncbi:hypothetical protein BD413DRAFT_475705 [Trametes elegans]|nr:hypothetical protein BD413DRAFT_475705 [Trametes elegans]